MCIQHWKLLISGQRNRLLHTRGCKLWCMRGVVGGMEYHIHWYLLYCTLHFEVHTGIVLCVPTSTLLYAGQAHTLWDIQVLCVVTWMDIACIHFWQRRYPNKFIGMLFCLLIAVGLYHASCCAVVAVLGCQSPDTAGLYTMHSCPHQGVPEQVLTYPCNRVYAFIWFTHHVEGCCLLHILQAEFRLLADWHYRLLASWWCVHACVFSGQQSLLPWLMRCWEVLRDARLNDFLNFIAALRPLVIAL